MKKKLFAICLLLVALLLTGCSDSEEPVVEVTGQPEVAVQEKEVDPDATIWSLGRMEGENWLDLFPSEEEAKDFTEMLVRGMDEGAYEPFEYDAFYYQMDYDDGWYGMHILKISDNGSAYMDGKRYVLSNADAILELLDVWSKETRILEGGWEIEEWIGIKGETLHIDVVGVPEGEVVTWTSDNESVCTVTGDACGADIKIIGSGATVVTVEWREQFDSITVYGGQKDDYATKIAAEDLRAAEQLARADYEAWAKEDWCISMKVLKAVVNDERSVEYRRRYEGSRDGWTKEYLAENYITVKVTYDCKLDHNKIWYEDGKITCYTILTRADADSPWEIVDYSYD